MNTNRRNTRENGREKYKGAFAPIHPYEITDMVNMETNIIADYKTVVEPMLIQLSISCMRAGSNIGDLINQDNQSVCEILRVYLKEIGLFYLFSNGIFFLDTSASP